MEIGLAEVQAQQQVTMLTHLTDEPPAKVVCCYCVPWHVMSEGVEPASHGACPIGVQRFESGVAL